MELKYCQKIFKTNHSSKFIKLNTRKKEKRKTKANNTM